MTLPGRLGVALSGHTRSWDETLALASAAETAGFDVVFVDGDEARIAGRPEARIYDGGLLSAAVLHATQRIHCASIRLPGFSHVAQVARALATTQLTTGGRALGFFGVGSGRHLQSLGLPPWTAAERVAALGETLEALRALWRGLPVTLRGTHTCLEEITAPTPEPAVPIVVAAARPRALELVARHADVWDANVPPLRRCLEPLRPHVPERIPIWLWVLARPDLREDQAIAQYRRWWPWFPELGATEYREALLFGDPAAWPERLARLREELGIDLAVLDLIGLETREAHRVLRAMRAAEPGPMP